MEALPPLRGGPSYVEKVLREEYESQEEPMMGEEGLQGFGQANEAQGEPYLLPQYQIQASDDEEEEKVDGSEGEEEEEEEPGLNAPSGPGKCLVKFGIWKDGAKRQLKEVLAEVEIEVAHSKPVERFGVSSRRMLPTVMAACARIVEARKNGVEEAPFDFGVHADEAKALLQNMGNRFKVSGASKPCKRMAAMMSPKKESPKHKQPRVLDEVTRPSSAGSKLPKLSKHPKMRLSGAGAGAGKGGSGAGRTASAAGASPSVTRAAAAGGAAAASPAAATARTPAVAHEPPSAAAMGAGTPAAPRRVPATPRGAAAVIQEAQGEEEEAAAAIATAPLAGLLDTDTLALLSAKTEQARKAQEEAATAARDVNRLTLERGTREAELEEAQHQLERLDLQLPAQLPAVALLFEGDLGEAKQRLAALRAELGSANSFLARAAEVQGPLVAALHAAHGAQAARPDIPAPTPTSVAAAMVGSYAGEGTEDSAGRCAVALRMARQLGAAAEALVADGVVPTLSELREELEGEVSVRKLRAEELKQGIEGYSAVVLHLPLLKKKRELEAAVRSAHQRLREIGSELEGDRATLKSKGAEAQQLTALCNRIRSG